MGNERDWSPTIFETSQCQQWVGLPTFGTRCHTDYWKTFRQFEIFSTTDSQSATRTGCQSSQAVLAAHRLVIVRLASEREVSNDKNVKKNIMGRGHTLGKLRPEGTVHLTHLIRSPTNFTSVVVPLI